MKEHDSPIWPDSETSSTVPNKELLTAFQRILINEAIPANKKILQNFSDVYLPLAKWVAQQHQKKPVIIGINGSQGSGKSTLCKILSGLLQQAFNKNIAILSIDDLYKTQEQRLQMAESTHPLFATRGVPGTHDVELGISVLKQLKQQNTPVLIPEFDKATDDRRDKKYWQTIDDNVDIILFEGWCVGATPQDTYLLESAVNELEENHDSDLIWRKHINLKLATEYQKLFSLIDKLIMLKIPDFNKVIEWRTLQENKLRNISNTITSGKVMSDKQLSQFIMHFERITKHTLNEMPVRADVILDINDEHQISKACLNKK